MADIADCRDGLVVDSLSRYSGCTVGADLTKVMGWLQLIFLTIDVPLFSSLPTSFTPMTGAAHRLYGRG